MKKKTIFATILASMLVVVAVSNFSIAGTTDKFHQTKKSRLTAFTACFCQITGPQLCATSNNGQGCGNGGPNFCSFETDLCPDE